MRPNERPAQPRTARRRPWPTPPNVSRGRVRLLVAGLAVLLLGPVLNARAADKKPTSPQAEKRRRLLEEMGLHPKTAAPPSTDSSAGGGSPAPGAGSAAGAPEVPSASPGQPKDGAPDGSPGKRGPGTTPPPPSNPVPVAPSFRRVIHPAMMQACGLCHRAGGPAAASRLVLGGSPAEDHAIVVRFVDVRNPALSVLLGKASGQMPHGGAAPWPAGSRAYNQALAWIRGGARLDAGSAAPPAASGLATGAVAGAPGAHAVGVAAPVTGVPRHAASAGQGAGAAAANAGTAEGTVEVPAAAQTGAAAGEVGAPAGETPGEAASSSAGIVAATPTPTTPAGPSFAADVAPVLAKFCAACHSAVGPAAQTHLVLSGDLDHDFASVRALVVPGSASISPLLVKATGQLHAGGAVLPSSGAEYRHIAAWIAAGAPGPGQESHGGTAPSAGASANGEETLPLEAAGPEAHPQNGGATTAPGAAAEVTPAEGPHHGAHGGLGMPGGFSLAGRFSLDYERRQFTGDPFDDGSTNALRSHHHFLFLSRESTDDPFGLSVEMLSLLFWEAHVRVPSHGKAWQLSFGGGKILVPFGAEPLFHQSYGGLAGFDQKVLPTVWAQEGAAAHGLVNVGGGVILTDDLFAVRGYALRQADGVLNLQNDFSSSDDTHVGWGNRAGVTWGPVSGWYSAYYNGLGFGRHLFMQALDVTLWRLRGVPVMEYLSLGAGVMRADVSGGGAGVGGPGFDYYHFASYFQLRAHPTEWLVLQYRQGVRTFNNRRGDWIDRTRLTSDDASTHNFGIIARRRGVSAGLFWFVNLEKGTEIPDDFFRASVTYEF